MSGAKEAILARIRAALDADTPGSAAGEILQRRFSYEEVQQRLNEPREQLRPALSGDKLELLVSQMEGVQMSVSQLQTSGEIVDQVNWYLESEGLSGCVSVAPALRKLAWSADTHFGAATSKEVASVTDCFGAVAETGSVVLASSSESPITLGFLPDTHVVVLKSSDVVGHSNDIWPLLRELPELPRGVNFVTGPSRTGDIEQTIEIGAHGPRRMHVLLIMNE
ncbi:MAG: lactate utilization protein [Granulosicoccaceae bacterium]